MLIGYRGVGMLGGVWESSSVGHEPARGTPGLEGSSRVRPWLESPRYLSMLECARAARILLQARADLLIPFRSRE